MACFVGQFRDSYFVVFGYARGRSHQRGGRQQDVAGGLQGAAGQGTWNHFVRSLFLRSGSCFLLQIHAIVYGASLTMFNMSNESFIINTGIVQQNL